MFNDARFGLTAERLRECLRYHPATGGWTWFSTNSPRRLAGSPAGELKPSGYVLIGIDGQRYRAHRLAWLYMTGGWPPRQVDHKSGVRSDNRWTNLRLASQVQNSANMRTRSNNALGVKGVTRFDGVRGTKYRAHLFIDGRQNFLGSFDTIEEAQEAYRSAAVERFGEFARVA